MQLPGRFLHVQQLPQFWFLGGHSGGAVVGIAHTGRHTTDGLKCRVGQCDAVSAQGHGFDEVIRHADTACDDQSHVLSAYFVQVMSGSCQCGNGWHRYVVPEDQRRSTRSASSPIQDDVVGTGVQGKLDVLLNVIGRQFETNGNPAGYFAHPIRKIAKIFRSHQVVKRRGRNGGRTFFEVPHFSNLPDDFVGRKVASGACLGALSPFEMECLYVFELIPVKSKLGRCQFIKVFGVGLLFFFQHTALAGTDTRTGQFSTFCQ